MRQGDFGEQAVKAQIDNLDRARHRRWHRRQVPHPS
jgi:hypothetical protein